MDYTIEKKVRPLYEAIDDGQNKQALQLANKLLKKNPDWPLVKALKALVLVRTDKDNEAAELCVQVKKTIPTDQATLLALTLAYQELGQNSAIVELYENAANQQPKNEEFANKWFMAMVRNGDHKGQQAAALKLHRTFKNDKYLFWAIMSLALQGKTSALSYTLAERMMAKAQEEGRLEEVEHLRLYLLILMDQKKHADALQLLDSSLGQKSLRDPEVRQIRAELLQENGKWDQLLQVAEHALVEENADDWISWIQYFDALAATSTDYEKGYALVERLKKAALDAPMLKRGPFLAELELDYRLIKLQKDQTAALGHIVSYFERFGSKSCCFEDIQTYIDVLKGDHPAATAFIQSLSNTLKESDEKSIRIKNVYKRVNIRKIERYLGLQSRLTIDEGVTLVNSLWKEYQDALPLGEDLEKTESQHGDEFALLACHVLVDLYREHKHIELLLQAISLLESALAKSIYNFHIKLSLVRLYSMIGVFNRPIQIYKTMDIKQIQFDTMIHYFTDRFISLGCYDDIESVLLESLRIYKSNDIETPEMIVKAYQYGTFSKIQEFIEFRSRLYHSLQHAISKIELARADAARSSFQIKYAMQCFQELDVSSIKCDDASIAQQSDNRDFKVFMNCNPKDQPKAEELMKPTKSTNKTWLQLFSYVLNILKSTCSSTKGGADIESMVKAFSQFLARDSMKDEVMPEEITLAKCVFELVSAYVLVKDQTTRKDNSDEAIKHLQNASGIIEKEVAPKSSFEEATISWQQFHQVSIALEVMYKGELHSRPV
ncbi:N-acetyltransferase B complex non catalytic subunit-domain-containing protein [Dichotomocladium elegans]|nr:N-acetyltransferase B complex non catalytic subunit-domain-containing protein [Dichotomocladium elegans]